MPLSKEDEILYKLIKDVESTGIKISEPKTRNDMLTLVKELTKHPNFKEARINFRLDNNSRGSVLIGDISEFESVFPTPSQPEKEPWMMLMDINIKQ